MVAGVKDPFAEARRRLEDTVLRGPGRTASSLREGVARREGLPEELRALVEKIEKHAYEVTDDDVARLRAKYTEDEIFEIVVAAALGASMRRLDAGMRALAEAEET
jgi:hypothetical protein